MRAEPSCAILVLNWNGRVHLAHLLPSLLDACAAYHARVPIVLVDNRSSDADVAWVRDAFPNVEVVVAPRNDYLFSLNAVVSARREDIVVLLNNDMRVAPDFLAPLLAHFGDPQVFAVAAAVHEWDGSAPQTGVRRIRLEDGWLTHWFEKGVTDACYTAEAGGGCSAFDRERFSALGGFDPLFRPGYWEDFDLTLRAWRQGWSSIFEPRSVIYHRGSATLGKTVNERAFRRLLIRNQTLCLLKTVGDWRFAATAFLRLPYRVCYHALWGEPAVSAGMLAALPRTLHALVGRIRLAKPRRSATEIATALDEPVRTGRAQVAA